MGGLSGSFVGKALGMAAAAAGGGAPPGGEGGDGEGEKLLQETPEQRVERIHKEANDAYQKMEREDWAKRMADPEYDRQVKASIAEARELSRRAKNAW